MDAGLLGPVGLWAAISFAVVGLVSGRRWALLMSAVATVSATGFLAVALLSTDFSLAYVAETTSLSTPWPYRLAALWGGMDGSMLFYTAMVIVVGVAAMRERTAVRVTSAVGLGLLLITMVFANPFDVLDLPAVDGRGLLAILQHPAMIYHPPLLYLGLTTLIVPFGSTVAMVLRGGDRDAWMIETKRWLYVSWTLLAFGMAAGSNWAYVELGWGGYWAWDPVENTALMPWVATTVFLHTSQVERATGRLRRWNVLFVGLPFALTVMGVYLTRSGATGSIHSFAEDPVVGRILLGSAAVVTGVVLVLAVRSEMGEPWGPARLDRNGWLALNGLLLAGALIFITAGSAYPAFASAFRGDAVSVDSGFFVSTVLPIAVIVAASLSLALARRRRVLVFAAALFALLSVVVFGFRVGTLLLAPAAVSLAAILTMFAKRSIRRGRTTALLAHMGMALFLVAVAGSSYGADFNGSMRPGDTVTVADHEVTLVELITGEEDRYVFVRAGFELDGEPISPEIRAYEDQSTPVAEPELRSSLVDDVIVAVSLLFPDAETVEVSVFVRPLVTWVWVGAILVGLGGLAALLSRDGAAGLRHRSAREEPLPAGTTSGTAAY